MEDRNTLAELAYWCRDNGILDVLFGAQIHVEVASRSAEIIGFLLEEVRAGVIRFDLPFAFVKNSDPSPF